MFQYPQPPTYSLDLYPGCVKKALTQYFSIKCITEQLHGGVFSVASEGI